MVPFGALFTLWGRDYSLSLKWFQYMFKTSGLKAFKDSFVLSLIAAPLTAFLSMVISYLVVKKRLKARGFIEFVSHAGHGGARHRAGYRIYQGLCQRPVQDRRQRAASTEPAFILIIAFIVQKPSHRHQERYLSPCARLTSPSRNPPTI
ncbi:MAG: hypothetical protein ACLR0U_30925 [Enterocloster clostridioformis]